MVLDLTSLTKALTSLKRAFERSEGAPDDEELRDAVIQRFEYTYELCWKMLRRRLRMDAASQGEIDQLSFRDLMREGVQRGLVADAAPWLRYRELRNLTTHLYDEGKAKRLRAAAGDFIADAEALQDALTRAAQP